MNTFFADTANVPAPATAKELADLVAGLHAAATPWLPCGLGSRLQWGPPVEMPSQPISVSGLNRILDHAVDDLTITVEAGLPLAELQMVLKEHHQWLAVNWPRGSQANTDPNSAGSVGGLVARGLAGGLRQRHLGIRDQLIGIGLLRSDGIAAHAGGRVVKNVAGYDLMRLLCGSWGSLALITELTLRCQPIRPAHIGLRLDGSLEALEAWRAALLRTSFTPEYCDWIKTDLEDWHLNIGVASVSDQAVNDQIGHLKALANQHQLGTKQLDWLGPHQEPHPSEGSFDSNHWLVRVALQPSNIHRLIASKELQALNGWHWQLAAGAGIGDGWQISPANAKGISQSEDLNALRHEIARLGGQLTLLQQPSQAGARLPAWLDAPSRPLIEAVKQQFDPKQQLARGRLPGVCGQSTAK